MNEQRAAQLRPAEAPKSRRPRPMHGPSIPRRKYTPLDVTIFTQPGLCGSAEVRKPIPTDFNDCSSTSLVIFSFSTQGSNSNPEPPRGTSKPSSKWNNQI